MKKKIFGFIALMFLTSLNFAQETDIKTITNNIIDLSKSKDYTSAASLFLYKGDDKDRSGNDSFDANNSSELNQVKRICKKISALLSLSSSYKVNEPIKIDANNFKVSVLFTSGEQTIDTKFQFTKTKKGFLLEDLD